MAQSQELKTWFMLAAGAAVLAGAGNRIGAGIRDPLRGYMGRVHAIEVDGPGTFSAMITLLVDIVLILMIATRCLHCSGNSGEPHSALWCVYPRKIETRYHQTQSS